LRAARADRRSFLTLAGAGGATLLFSSAAAAAPVKPAASRRRSYVLVVDGCRPDEITTTLTPNLAALRAGGTNFPRAKSVPVMETIPNHVMMMTGVRPPKSGVPANQIYDRALGDTRTMDRPTDITARTVIEQLNNSGFTTGTVLSKEYLYGVFGDRATHRWEPFPLVPVSGHAPDQFTMDATLAMVDEFDPHLVFVNLGDIDRFGHSDVTGTTVQLARQLALADTDLQVGRLIAMLKATGRWERSAIVVLADHSMDWSLPGSVVTLSPLLEADPTLAGKVEIADNGGADLLYFTGPTTERAAAVTRMRDLARSHPGVLAAYVVGAPGAPEVGPLAGDVLVYCRAGWRFSDPGPLDNPIPGNHGHPATLPIPFFLAGGHPSVRRGTSSADARTLDVAPTLGAFFGLAAPRTDRPDGGIYRYEGVSRL